MRQFLRQAEIRTAIGLFPGAGRAFVSAMAAAAKTDHVFRYVVVRRPLEVTLGVMDDQLPARN